MPAHPQGNAIGGLLQGSDIFGEASCNMKIHALLKRKEAVLLINLPETEAH